MGLDVDLDKLQVEVTLLQYLQDFVQLETPPPSCSTDPMVFDLGISTLTLTPGLFDRLVTRGIIRPTNDPSANIANDSDEELSRLGLLGIKVRDTGVDHFMGNPTTSVATYDVSITYVGRVVLTLAGVMAIIESFIRQGLFFALEVLLSLVSREVLPELLAHGTLRVRELALERLAQVEEE